MSDNPYEQFFSAKEEADNRKKLERSVKTLEYYEIIEELLDSVASAGSTHFLMSVQNFIEEKEYITDKQMEIIDGIKSRAGDFFLPEY